MSNDTIFACVRVPVALSDCKLVTKSLEPEWFSLAQI